VLVPYQAYPYLLSRMVAENTAGYFYNIFLPFVTDVFTNFALVGLPMNVKRMDELRTLFTYATGELNKLFVAQIVKEAQELFLKYLSDHFGTPGLMIGLECLNLLTQPSAQAHNLAMVKVTELFTAKPEQQAKAAQVLAHLRESPGFNIRSSTMMRRWLFDVVGLTPIKSTNNKAKGMPTTDWEKVMTMPPSRQKDFTPACDKQTLQILSDQFDTLNMLLDLNAVGNLSKAFLKEPSMDDEGNLTRENGLHYWLCSDDRVHCNYSTTDTGRPRSWKPNTLNWPKYLNKRISNGIGSLLLELKSRDVLPPEFHGFIEEALKEKKKSDAMKVVGKNVPSIRACVDASTIPPLPGSQGWCMIESDYQTAEIRGKAFMSGDANLIRLMTEPDAQYGLIMVGNDKVPVRMGYDDSCGIPKANQNPQAVMHLMTEGVVSREVKPEELLRNKEGKLLHPSHDLHWSLAEWVHGKPREELSKAKDRDGMGKVGNFSTTYGAVGSTLERKIKSDAGFDPPEGTGDKIISSLAKREPVATAWLENDLQNAPADPGYLVAKSGRKRHFAGYGVLTGNIGSYERKKQLSASGRVARNFPMQESVASTAARAGIGLIDEYRTRGMYAQLMTILYDSCVSLCPIEERFMVWRLHEIHMSERNKWVDHGREWNYPTDCEINIAWSTKPDKAMKAKLEDRTWASDPTWISPEHKKIS
jgi:hypothetical protein